ncbi:hypothetical protein K9T45_000127 [Campylobacter jejuni]|nr:hypothetical protein [Campylobacter jejuni]ETJ82155.1 hypothetical protein X908_05480 [Campylobacter jejuni subsp. jejuni 81-176-DRH212]HBK1860532.1 hypothetical protein [Campylobacter jejuni]
MLENPIPNSIIITTIAVVLAFSALAVFLIKKQRKINDNFKRSFKILQRRT